MKEMEDALGGGRCLVLFPTEGAKTFENVVDEASDIELEDGWDVVVVDGTWTQARRLHSRYIMEGAIHVQLSDQAVEILSGSSNDEKLPGHQIRRHPVKWREVSTLEATRLLLGDMMSTTVMDHPWDTLATYQQNGDAAALRQLGPPRKRSEGTTA